MIKEINRKDTEQEVLLEGLERLMTKISSQNVDNMTTYNENMTVLVQSMKDTISKTEGNCVSSPAGGVKMAKLTKPAKVPSWTKDLTLKTYSK